MWDRVCDNNDTSQDYVNPGEGDVMCINTQPYWERLQQECTVNNPSSVGTNKRKVTYHDFTDVANSVTNLALSLPTEDARMECLGIFIQMRDALSISAGGHLAFVPLSGFMSSAEEFLSTFGPNADSRRERVFAEQDKNTFEMQRHNIGKVRHKQRTS
jgi:hypothetical protein